MPTDTDTLTFLVNTLRAVAVEQHRLAAQFAASPIPVGADFARGYAAGLEKAADIVAEQLPRTDKES